MIKDEVMEAFVSVIKYRAQYFGSPTWVDVATVVKSFMHNSERDRLGTQIIQQHVSVCLNSLHKDGKLVKYRDTYKLSESEIVLQKLKGNI